MMFRPRESYDQRVLEARLNVSPAADVRHVHDVFGNAVGVATFAEPADELAFESLVRLEHTPAPLVSDESEALYFDRAVFPFAYDADDMPDLLRSIERQHPDPDGAVERWARSFMRRSGPTPVLALLGEMTRAIHADFAYAQRLERGVQTPIQTLESRTGACRDYAMLMMEAARSLGLAARFVSGYVYSAGGGGSRKGGGHTHAWVRVYLPSCGWAEFDPTNGIIGATDLIRVAVTRDPRQAVPLSGTWAGDPGDYLGMDVEVDVDVEPDPASLRLVV
jgi:transglutaminase-like putative cysteine protease